MPLMKASAADEADARIGFGLRDQMLGAAEADFQAHFVDVSRNSVAQIGGRRLREIERDARQQRIEQRRLARAQRMALAPAEEGALRLSLCVASLSSCVIARA